MTRSTTSLQLDSAMKERVRRLRTDALAAWADYQTTGLHLTAEEADTWLAKLAAGKRAAIPKWHV